MKALAFLPLALLLACGRPAEGPKEQADETVVSVGRSTPEAAAAPSEIAPKATSGASEDAAEVLKLYYDLIAAGDYEAAWRLRWSGAKAASAAELADSFSGYGEYRASVGTPTAVAAANGFDYVEVPVQIYGRLKSGKPFATAGTVTLRRRADVGEWRIYTG